MHAASVHPEPGSNSRINCIKITPLGVFQSFRAFFLSFFYFCLSSILFQNFTRSFFRTIFLLSLCTSSISCCSIFNDQLRCLSKYTASLLYHIHISFVKCFFHLFKTFFEFFMPSCLRPCYIITSAPLCQEVFESFFDFFESFFIKNY